MQAAAVMKAAATCAVYPKILVKSPAVMPICSRMAKAMNTTLFIQNAACGAALGTGGAGYLSYSIATPTGEGVTTPMTFTRERQLTIAGALRII